MKIADVLIFRVVHLVCTMSRSISKKSSNSSTSRFSNLSNSSKTRQILRAARDNIPREGLALLGGFPTVTEMIVS